jgi:hypothetical protein
MSVHQQTVLYSITLTTTVIAYFKMVKAASKVYVIMFVFGTIYTLALQTRVLQNLAITASTTVKKNGDDKKSFALLNIHIEKTGGSTLSGGLAQLCSNYSRGAVAFVDHPFSLTLPDFLSLFGKNHDLIHSANVKKWNDTYAYAVPLAVSAHPVGTIVPIALTQWNRSSVLLGKLWGGERKVLVSTLFREPRQRIMSHWYYFQRPRDVAHPDEASYLEWVEYVQSMGSLYVSRFSSVKIVLNVNMTPSEFGFVNQDAVSSAIATLNTVDIIGRTECVRALTGVLKELIFDNDTSRVCSDEPSHAAEFGPTLNVGQVSNKFSRMGPASLQVLDAPSQGGYVLDHLVYQAIFATPPPPLLHRGNIRDSRHNHPA